jgi:hypothetical protein
MRDRADSGAAAAAAVCTLGAWMLGVAAVCRHCRVIKILLLLIEHVS